MAKKIEIINILQSPIIKTIIRHMTHYKQPKTHDDILLYKNPEGIADILYKKKEKGNISFQSLNGEFKGKECDAQMWHNRKKGENFDNLTCNTLNILSKENGYKLQFSYDLKEVSREYFESITTLTFTKKHVSANNKYSDKYPIFSKYSNDD